MPWLLVRRGAEEATGRAALLIYEKIVISNKTNFDDKLSAETGGRFEVFSKFLKEVVTSCLDFGESLAPVWTKEKRAFFASRLRSAHVTTSYAIAHCVANALIHGSKTIARYPLR